MLYLSNVLQLVIHRFYYSTLTEQKLVGYAHQGSFQKPKNQPMEHVPLCAMPLNTLWTCILWFRHTLKGRAVRETYACAFAEQHLLDEQCQRHGNFFFKLYKPVV